MRLVLATKNKGKLEELRAMFSNQDIEIISMDKYPDIPDVIEDGKTFLENAGKKARSVSAATGEFVLADDSGLVVDALDGEPGVHSARFAGKQNDYAANNKKLLDVMKNVPDGKRQAAFVCTMVLISPTGREWVTEGRCEGIIMSKPGGDGGFGYDPLFFVPEEGLTMAELSMDRKNVISHRGKALRKMQKILVEIFSKKGHP